jgi:DNA-directed RNA polymerase specialized sigma24 family protein
MSKKFIDRIKAEQLRLEGKSYPEIAEIIGCSVSWAKQNLSGVPKKRVCRCCGRDLVKD